MKAPAAMQQELIGLAQCDRDLGQLAHRLSALPARAELAAVVAALTTAEADLTAVATGILALESELARADSDVAAVRERIVRDQARMDDGSAPARELVSLTHEVSSLVRRQADLEDLELEVMERLEAATRERTDLAQRIGDLQQRREALSATVAQALAEAEQEQVRLQQRRDGICLALDPELRALYERIRAERGDVGAVRLTEGRCDGCRLVLTPADRQRCLQADPDEVLRCEDCRRILVRDGKPRQPLDDDVAAR